MNQLKRFVKPATDVEVHRAATNPEDCSLSGYDILSADEMGQILERHTLRTVICSAIGMQVHANMDSVGLGLCAISEKITAMALMTIDGDVLRRGRN